MVLMGGSRASFAPVSAQSVAYADTILLKSDSVKGKVLGLALAAMTALGFIASPSNASTVSCNIGNGGNSLTASLDSATMAACFDGNDTNTIDSAFEMFGVTGWVLAAKSGGADGDGAITYTDAPSNGNKTGSWGISGFAGAAQVVLTLKAGHFWGSFLLDSTSGNWATSKDLSHSSIYYIPGITNPDPDPNTPLPTPVPASLPLLLGGLGLFAIVAKRRRKTA